MNSLTARAAKIYPTRRNAAKWVLAVKYLRRRNLWVLESGRTPKWGNKS